jgi:nucleotide-binding universal stress UspA family protein
VARQGFRHLLPDASYGQYDEQRPSLPVAGTAELGRWGDNEAMMDSQLSLPRPVVVGVDASASARDAADWAADLAAAWNAPLHLVQVVLGWPDEAPLPPRPSGWLRELVDAAERTGVPAVEAEVVPGGIVDTLLERATGARMLVVGSYGEAAWTGMLAGSLAVTLIDRAPCPVAVIRGSEPQVPPPRSGPIVVGVDGSKAGGVALDLAAELAASLGARLVVVRATADSIAEPAEAQLAAVRFRYPALPVHERVVDGMAVSALGKAAPEARMLVIGRHGAGSGLEVTLGATGHELVESAPCPVLIAGPANRELADSPSGPEQATR